MSPEGTSSVTLRAPAKINLTLDVLGLRPDGYHEIASIMQTISLADKVTVARGAAGISLTVDGPEAEGVPTDERNLAWKAAEALGAPAVGIHIEKNIPAQAGLGGGSSDAAAVLLALNRLINPQRSLPELARIAQTLGSDVPFFLHGGTARVEGRGEKIMPLDRSPELGLVIVKPPVGVSTAEAYWLLDELPTRRSACATSRWPEAGFSNDFEAGIYSRYLEIAAARDALRNACADPVLVCGSGSAVFGVSNNPEQAAARVGAMGVGKVYLARTTRRRD